MPTNLRQVRLRDVVILVAVVAVVAIVVVLVGRELGVGRDTAAVSEDASELATAEKAVEPLTLSLSGPDICETERGKGYSGEAWVYDDEGEIVGTRTISLGWANIAEVPVRWEVSGGTGPYTLVIDNEHRDAFRPYGGTTGEASVSCALTPGEVSYNYADKHRWYHADPQADSGLKTIRATVTDSSGATAVASLVTYVILQLSDSGYSAAGEHQAHRLNPGKTYRYNGVLFTVPKGITLVAGASWEGEGGWGQELHVDGTDVTLTINRHGQELYRAFGSTFVRPSAAPEARDRAQGEASAGLGPESLAISDRLDLFLASRGEPPAASAP